MQNSKYDDTYFKRLLTEANAMPTLHNTNHADFTEWVGRAVLCDQNAA